MTGWTDKLVREQMAVDQTFNAKITDSEFTNQEWGLIMTAAEFDVENAAEPDRARLVIRTDKLPQMLPELEKVRNAGPSGMGGGPGESDGRDGGGFFDMVRDAFGLGDDDSEDEQRLEAAEELVDQYAREIQDRLEAEGNWEDVRTAYLEESEN
jgi:hypothetical protein